MIPFLATQLERGAGTIESVIRPIVPSMFETSAPNADPLHEDVVEHSSAPQSVVAEIRTGREPARTELPFESVSKANRERPWPSFVADRETSIPDQKLTPSPLEWTTPAAGPGSRFDPPAPQSIAPPLVPEVASAFHPHVDQRPGPSDSKNVEMPNPRTPTPTGTSHDRLESEFSDLRRRIDSLAQLRDVPSIPSVVESIAMKPAITPQSIGQKEQRESGPSAFPQGIVPQQTIPQIQTPQEPPATPTITVSIGRIEFRNSSRRADPAPTPASNPQRPASRVMSLEDYLRTQSAGGP